MNEKGTNLKYKLTNHSTIRGYPNETCWAGYLSSPIFELLQNIENPTSYPSINKLIAACKEIIPQIRNKLLTDWGSGNAFNARSILAMIRLQIRIEGICHHLENGKKIMEVYAPYEHNGGDLAKPKLFIETDNALNQKYTAQALEILNILVTRNKFNYYSSGFHWTWEEGLKHLVECDPNVNDYLQLLFRLMKLDSMFVDNFKIILGYCENFPWDKITDYFLKTEDVFGFLVKNKAKLLDIFLLALAEKKNAGSILLKDISLFHSLAKTLSIEEFFGFIQKLSLEGNTLFPNHIFNDTVEKYFKALLMLGFNYRFCLNNLIKNFNTFPTQATAVLYEAVVSGDQSSVEQISQATNSHEVSKEEISKKNTVDHKNGFFGKEISKQKTVLDSQFTKFDETISYNLNDLVQYLCQKYTIAANKNELYFVKHLDEFIATLSDLMTITNKGEFKRQLCQALSLDIKEDIVMSESNPVSSDISTRLDRLESSNLELKQELTNLKKSNEELLQCVKTLESCLSASLKRITELEKEVRPSKVSKANSWLPNS